MSTYAQELADAEKTITITPVPLIMNNAGDKFRGMYIGIKTWPKLDAKTGELIDQPVAHFYDGEKIVFNMGAQLTRAISDLKPGVSVEIVLSELKKNKHNGNTKIYSITPLKVPVKNLEEMFGGFLNIAPPAEEHLIAAPAATPEPDLDKASNADVDAWLAEKDKQTEAERNAARLNNRAAVYGN